MFHGEETAVNNINQASRIHTVYSGQNHWIYNIKNSRVYTKMSEYA